MSAGWSAASDAAEATTVTAAPQWASELSSAAADSPSHARAWLGLGLGLGSGLGSGLGLELALG